MRLTLLTLTLAAASASDVASESFMGRPARILGGGDPTAAATGDADVIDSFTEEKTPPHSVMSWVYTAMTPFLGLFLFIMSFPIIWFNEQRANGALEKLYGEVPQEDGMAGQAKAAEFTGEKKFLTKEHELERKMFPCCGWKCCECIEKMCAKMPKGSTCDVKAWAVRFGGFVMMLIGVQMMFAPLFWAINYFWLLAAVIGGHLALFIVKYTCCACCCTSFTSQVAHRPMLVVGTFFFFALMFAAWIYYMTPRGKD